MKLEIKKFGPISNSSFDIKKLNLFIGESATGKSIVTKLIYLCNTFPENIRLRNVSKDISFKGFGDALQLGFIDSFDQIFGFSYKQVVFAYYYSEENYLEFSGDTTSFSLTFSPGLNAQINSFHKNWQATAQDLKAGAEADDFSLFMHWHLFTRRVKRIFTQNDYLYIPAGRSFFTLLSDNIFSLIETGVGIDQILSRFGVRFSVSRKKHTTDDSAFDGLGDGSLQERFRTLMKGSYRFENDEDRFYLAEGHFLPFNQISSGQQELLPALIVLLDTLRSKTPVSIIFEEPEAHLFPKDQKRLIELLVYMLNLSKNKNKLFVTTHSPYLLSSVNNMIYAGKLNSGLMEKQLHLNFSDTAAYALADGRASSILNVDNQLIDAAYIDSVSGDIAGLFDKLLDEEYGDD